MVGDRNAYPPRPQHTVRKQAPGTHTHKHTRVYLRVLEVEVGPRVAFAVQEQLKAETNREAKRTDGSRVRRVR